MTSGEEWTPMDRKSADSLLRGDRTGHALDRVLAAAQAPAAGHELAGEDAVMAAFRAAAHTPVPRRRKPSALQSCLARMLTLKVAAVAFATSATVGGVALTAHTAALHDTPVSAPESSAATGDPTVPPSSPAPSPTPSPRASASTPVSASAVPKHRVTDFCTDFERSREQAKRFTRNRDEAERACRSRSSSPHRAPSVRPTRERDGGHQQWPGGSGHDDDSGPPRR